MGLVLVRHRRRPMYHGMCTCHAKHRTFDFETSLSSVPCWCGLVVLNRPHVSIPVRLGVTFWKSTPPAIFETEPSLKTIIIGAPHEIYFVANYLVGQAIGRGTYQKVRRGLRKDPTTGVWTPVALKVPIFTGGDAPPVVVSGWAKIQAELTLHSCLNHPNIASILEVLCCAERDVWIVVMEYVPHQPLRFFSEKDCYALQQHQSFYLYSEEGARHVIRQVLEALKYLQDTHAIVHKDIKPENLLLTTRVPPEWLRDVSTMMMTVHSSWHEAGNDDTFDYSGMSDATEVFLWDGCETEIQSTTLDSGLTYGGVSETTMKCYVEAQRGNGLTAQQRVQLLLTTPTHVASGGGGGHGIKRRRHQPESDAATTEAFRSSAAAAAHDGGGTAALSEDRFCWCCAIRCCQSGDSDSGRQHQHGSPHDVSNKTTCETSTSFLSSPDARCCCCHSPLLHRDLTSVSPPEVAGCPATTTEKPEASTTALLHPVVKLIDFNTAVQTQPPDHEIHDAEGSRHFTPPECLLDSRKRYGYARDMWSVGVLAYCLVAGTLPFRGPTPLELLLDITQREPTYPDDLSSDLLDFLTYVLLLLRDPSVRGLLRKNPEKRYTLQQALEHPWLRPNASNILASSPSS